MVSLPFTNEVLNAYSSQASMFFSSIFLFFCVGIFGLLSSLCSFVSSTHTFFCRWMPLSVSLSPPFIRVRWFQYCNALFAVPCSVQFIATNRLSFPCFMCQIAVNCVYMCSVESQLFSATYSWLDTQAHRWRADCTIIEWNAANAFSQLQLIWNGIFFRDLPFTRQPIPKSRSY